MGKTWAIAVLAAFVVATSSVCVSAEDPPAGLSALEWRQITSSIELEQERRGGEAGKKHIESLYALAQKLGPEPTIPHGRFGYSVAIDGDVAVVGAAWAHLAFVFAREPEGWQLQQTLEGIWEEGLECNTQSRYFGYSVAIDGSVISIGAPGYGCYYDNGTASWYGNAFIFEWTLPGSWSLTRNVLDTLDTWVPFAGSYLGTSISVFGSTIVTGASGFSDDRGGCVVVKKTNGQWTYEDLILAPTASVGDLFGFSIALFGDTLVVGVPNDTVLVSSQAGRVHVFNRSGESWTHTADLTASDSGSGNHFGTSVSIVPPTILVGAPDDDHAAGVDAGSAYVLTETGGVWTQSQKLVALDGETGDRFGAAVSLGFGVVLIGAPGDNHGMLDIDAGSAYVFKPIVDTWFQDEKILAPDGETSDHFGSAVALWGSTALVGSPFDDGPNITESGSAHFFEEDAGVWAHDETVVGPMDGLEMYFGTSVALDGETLVVGVIDGAWFGPGSAATYIYARVGDTWDLEWVLSVGGSVAVSGDTVVVGIPKGGLFMGVANVYTREFGILGSTWEFEDALLAGDGVEGDRFGAAVAIDGDTVVVGAPQRDIGGDPDCGAVYAFSRSGAVWHEDQLIIVGAPSAEDLFGGSIALEGDLLVAGSRGNDLPSVVDSGAAFVFRRVAGDWAEDQKLTGDVPQAGEYFGHDVALDGATLVVGAPGVEVSGHPGAGEAHVFVEAGGVWSGEQQLTASIPNTGNMFGWSVDLAGDTAVIGIPAKALHPYGRVGSAQVFQRSGSSWSRHQELFSDAPAADALFGDEIAVTPDGIVVAAYAENYLPAHPGAVYWFEGSIVETDLSIAMDDGVTEVVPGTGVSYLTVVTNAGPSEAMGATVSDPFPPELLNCSWTCDAFGGALCTPGPVAGDIADSVDLPVAGRLEYTAACTVASSATGTLVNTATVTAPPGVADTDPLDNTASDVDTLTPEADLSIGKDNGVTQLIEGETTAYTIPVTNAGPSDASASIVTDVFPVELSDCSWNCSPSVGAACTAAGTGDIDDLADLPAGGGVTYLATCTVAAFAGQCSNTAEVMAASGSSGVVDPNLLNNDATDSDEVIGLADLVFADGFESGGTATWSVVAP